MKKLFILVCITTVAASRAQAQGCVAIRSNGSTCALMEAGHAAHDNWSLSLNYRKFSSFRHFVKTQEQKHRVENHTEVINHTHTVDLGLTRIFNNRWSVAVYVPVTNNVRSSLYEHSGTKRYTTRSFGVGDLRIAAYRWMMDPAKHLRGNVQVGLGLKLPTGDFQYKDKFYKNDSTFVLGPVDQSIQLGDGDTGITLEVNAYHHFSPAFSVYGNVYYLANPREHNGVSTARGGTPSAAQLRYGSDVMSVPDQYMLRGGVSYGMKRFTVSGGVRFECVPAEDLIGGSNGFRRPGYVLSAEPVVAYRLKKTQFYLSVPVAFERSRTQSVPDKIRSRLTGTDYTGDAAFADYSVNLGVSFLLK